MKILISPLNYPIKKMEELIKETDNFFFDCDGVLWKGSHTIPKALETLENLRSKNKKLFFITNNSSNTREEYQKKLKTRFNMDVKKEEILTSGYSVALHLSSISFKRKIYVIGSNSLKTELKQEGLNVFETCHNNEMFNEEEVSKMKVDEEIGAIVVGYDNKLNNFKLAYAHLCFQKIKDCLFIATNLDSTFPYGDILLPGTGSIVNCVSTFLGRKPLVFGKPEIYLFKHLNEKYNIDLKKSVMIGDRLDTDILMGKNSNVKTILVLTGVTKKEDLKTNNIHPDYIIESIASLL